MKTLIFLILLRFAWCHLDEYIRETPQGKLYGKSDLDRKGRIYYSFLSIPFAKPPLGKLRFRPPEEAESWKGILNATVGHPVCSQRLLGNNVGEEDCLYLNVHTPQNKYCRNRLMPVFVFVHGGNFLEGSGQDYGPKFLMSECVVLVTINYRLGIFGFLNSDDESLGIPGNAALKDQNMALRWVKKYIQYFGGDGDNVILVGESAGAASVHLHMLSPISKGLFHKIVVMSGSAEQGWSFGKRNNIEGIGRYAGIQSNNVSKILHDLTSMPSDKILKIQDNFPWVAPVNVPFECSPIKEFDHPGAFITSRPLDIINSGQYPRMPIMIGYTNQEGVIGEVLHRLKFNTPFIVTNFSTVVPQNINRSKVDLNVVAQEIKTFYFGTEEPSLENLQKSANLFSGIWFMTGLPMVIKAHVRQKRGPVYLYRFSADTTLNYVKRLTPETAHYKGAIHIEDLSYIFDTIHTPNIKVNSKEDIAIDNTVKLFTNYAKFGNPGKNWLPVTPNLINCMDIGIHPKPCINPDEEVFSFWDDFYEKYL